jgi:hypothetical protein
MAGGEGMDAPIGLVRGQRLEIHLSPAVKWHLTMIDGGHILSPASIQGWYSQQLHACVWRFTAVGTGSAQLVFGGTFTCQPGVHCAYVAMAQDFAVSVR